MNLPNLQSAELDFRVVWRSVLDGKKRTLVFILCAMVLSLIVWKLRTPIYESVAEVEVGRVGLIWQLDRLGVTLKYKNDSSWIYESSDLKGAFIQNPEELAAQYNPGAEKEPPSGVSPGFPRDIVQLRFRGNSPVAAQDEASQKLHVVLDQHQAVFSAAMENQKTMLDSINKDVDSIEEQLRLLGDVKVSAANPVGALVIVQRAQLLEALIKLKSHLSAMKLIFSSLMNHRTRLISGPTLPLETLNKKLSIHLTVGFLLGLFFGVVASVFLEVPAGSPKRHSDA